MTTFDDRETAFEQKFAHDEELRFKVIARRNKLFGLWAAGVMGLEAAAADAYAKEVVMADFERSGDDDVLQKVLADLTRAEIGAVAAELRARMNELLEEAAAQIMAE